MLRMMMSLAVHKQALTTTGCSSRMVPALRISCEKTGGIAWLVSIRSSLSSK